MEHNTFVCLTVVELSLGERRKEAGRFFAKPGIPELCFFAGFTEKRGS